MRKSKYFIVVVLLSIVGVISLGAGVVISFKEVKEKDNSVDLKDVIDNDNEDNKQEENNSDEVVKQDFLFEVEDFYDTEEGPLLVGEVLVGKVKVGDKIQIVGYNDENIITTISEIKLEETDVTQIEEGNYAQILLKDVSVDVIMRGQVLSSIDYISSYTSFDAEVTLLSKEEGGRKTPILSGDISSFYFWKKDVDGTITLPDEVESFNPGDTVTIKIDIVDNVAMDVGTEFSLRAGGRLIGTGKVVKVY